MTRLVSAALLLFTYSTASLYAQGAGNLCKNRITIDTVYDSEAGHGRIEYLIRMRSVTKEQVEATVVFANFPRSATIYRTSMKSAPLDPFDHRDLRFGWAQARQLHMATVQRLYDTVPTHVSGPYILLRDCRVTSH